MKVCKSPLPENSRIVRYPDANYRDCFRCRLQIPGKVSPNQVMAAFWTTSPAWLKFLFRLRDLLVRPFGLVVQNAAITWFGDTFPGICRRQRKQSR